MVGEGWREGKVEEEEGWGKGIWSYIIAYNKITNFFSIFLFFTDLKYAFQIVGQDQPATTFYAISKMEKIEWMAALTLLLTRSTFDRLLDSKLREEEQNITVLTPDPNQYKWVGGGVG